MLLQNTFMTILVTKEMILSYSIKIRDVLVSKVLDVQEIDSEFKNIVERLLQRLNEVKDVEANASFDCLRETMQLYLQQIPSEGKVQIGLLEILNRLTVTF